MNMKRVKRRVHSGIVLEQEVYTVAPNTKNLRAAEPKPPREMTEEQRQRHNDLAALRRFTRIVNNNFTPQSLYVTLTFSDDFLPESAEDARLQLENYIRRLKYAAPDMAYVAVMGKGITSERWHYHMILDGVTEETISNKWNMGEVKRIENMRAHNIYDGVDHGADYTGLARYLFLHWTPEQGKGKRWKQSTNIIQPEKEAAKLVKRHYSIKKPPRAPKGYKLVESRQNEFGHLYFKYVKISNADSGHPRN